MGVLGDPRGNPWGDPYCSMCQIRGAFEGGGFGGQIAATVQESHWCHSLAGRLAGTVVAIYSSLHCFVQARILSHCIFGSRGGGWIAATVQVSITLMRLVAASPSPSSSQWLHRHGCRHPFLISPLVVGQFSRQAFGAGMLHCYCRGD